MTVGQRRLIHTLVVEFVVLFCLALGLQHFLGVHLMEIVPVGMLVGISSVWQHGGGDEWKRLSRSSQTLLVSFAAAAIFTCFAIGARHDPNPLILALMGTTALAGLFLLYLLFSRAMDSLWYRFQRRNPR